LTSGANTHLDAVFLAIVGENDNVAGLRGSIDGYVYRGDCRVAFHLDSSYHDGHRVVGYA
jgi:hypothetical protein